MVWSFLDGCWFLTDSYGKQHAIIECWPSTRTIFTPGGNQQLSKLTHTLEDCQKLAEVLVRLGE
jgi:hypothetical protein